MKRIKLTQGKFALVSDEDYEFLSQWKWCACKDHKTFYAVRGLPGVNGKPTTIKMHRVIAERIGIKNPDHKDQNGLNNQRSNLREATQSQQIANQNLRRNNTSGYKGVSWFKRAEKWRAYIRVSRKQIYLGLFMDIKDAAKAYNKAALKYFGEFAVLNKV
jgi:hypothetical protein